MRYLHELGEIRHGRRKEWTFPYFVAQRLIYSSTATLLTKIGRHPARSTPRAGGVIVAWFVRDESSASGSLPCPVARSVFQPGPGWLIEVRARRQDTLPWGRRELNSVPLVIDHAAVCQVIDSTRVLFCGCQLVLICIAVVVARWLRAGTGAGVAGAPATDMAAGIPRYACGLTTPPNSRSQALQNGQYLREQRL
jgi:hypothetical protein